MRVRFSDEAWARLQAIRDYISQDSPQAADAMIGKLIDRAQQVGDLPYVGRVVPEYRIDDAGTALSDYLSHPRR